MHHYYFVFMFFSYFCVKFLVNLNNIGVLLLLDSDLSYC